MSTVNDDGGIPRLRDQLDEIKLGSPLAVLGMFVEVVRARFRGVNEDTGYIWRADPTPLPTEDGTVNAPRSLYIEPGDGTDPEARDMRPAVFVDKEDTQLRQVVIGDRSDFDRQTRTERYYMHGVIPVTMRCVSDNRAESAILGDLVWFHIASAKNYIRAAFGINDIAAPVLSKTQMFRRAEGGTDMWNTTVSFAVTIEFHWITRPVAPLLKEVHATLRAAGAGDATLGAIEVATRTTRTR